MTADGIRVGPFDGSPAEWDAFVRSASGATHCHKCGWLDVMRGVFGHDCLYLAAWNPAGELSAVLPLVRVKSVVFGHYLASMPFLNYGGPIGSDDAVAALVRAAQTLGERDGVKLIELRNRAPWGGGVPVPDGWVASTRKITVVRDISPGSGAAPREKLWKDLPAKVRSQVRRPQKEGVTVRFGREQVGPFFDVFARHMRDLGTPTQSRRFFEAIEAAFPDDAWFGCAYLADRAVAGGCGFAWGTEFEMTWASALNEHKRLAPNMLLYWAFMERAADQGLSQFNFGRCTPNSGTHRFKQQWGTRDEQLWWYDFAAGRRSASAKTPSPDDAAFAWGPRIWKRLPVAMATALGPRVVKYIP